ncbi:VPLPA-CTERM sorting domain-containing protein [Rhodovulum sp. DZ06]|uniref:VPLPA-CTERM sorting domain-containing protein n=1 Tax=Rhodovulum sp. DZ06 TaxID=3425126 RepID=UPI003D343170
MTFKHSVAAAAALTLAAGAANAAAIIDNGTVQLGVDDFGQLNISGGVASPVEGTTSVGLRHLATGNESTSHGCLCEGWGVGIADTGASGSANNDFGVSNLVLDSFVSTASTATSTTSLASGELQIVHEFAPAAETPNLYRVSVSITNTSGVAINDLRYTRTFDWDIEPDTFDEFVSHFGTAAASTVLLAVDNGFVDSDPFAFRSEQVLGGTGDFVDLGPDDHGSNFDFGFGALGVDETFTFDIFYGAAATEADADAALAAVAAEVASYGQGSSDAAGETFIFAFADVGGEVIIPQPPSDVPLPAGAALMLTGLAALGAARRRKG